MTELIIIRHGETDWNRQHRFQGQIDVPLNALGLQQAERMAAALAHEPIDVLLASDLQRAQSTAQALLPYGKPALRTDARWREQGFGILEGVDVPTIQRDYSELWQQWTRFEADYALPQGGESNVAFYARIGQALDTLVDTHAGQRVAVVTHGGVLDMLWRRVHELPLSGPRECAIPNTGINRLRWDGHRWHILSWAEADHLEHLPEQPSTSQRF